MKKITSLIATMALFFGMTAHAQVDQFSLSFDAATANDKSMLGYEGAVLPCADPVVTMTGVEGTATLQVLPDSILFMQNEKGLLHPAFRFKTTNKDKSLNLSFDIQKKQAVSFNKLELKLYPLTLNGEHRLPAEKKGKLKQYKAKFSAAVTVDEAVVANFDFGTFDLVFEAKDIEAGFVIKSQVLEKAITVAEGMKLNLTVETANPNEGFYLGVSEITIGNGDVTGIEGVEASPVGDAAYYDLSGRRVEHPAKGIYVVNGQKVFVK